MSESLQTLPASVWTSRVLPAPKTADALSQISHFLNQLGYTKTVKALSKEATSKAVALNDSFLPNPALGPLGQTLGDLYVDAFLNEEDDSDEDEESEQEDSDLSDDTSSDEESEDSDSSDSDAEQPAKSEVNQIQKEIATSTKRKREASVNSSESDSSSANSASDSNFSDSDSSGPALKRTKIASAVSVKTNQSSISSDSGSSSSSASDSSESNDDSSSKDENEDESDATSDDSSSDDSDSEEDQDTETETKAKKPAKKNSTALNKASDALGKASKALSRKQSDTTESESSATLVASPQFEPVEDVVLASTMHPARQQRLDDTTGSTFNHEKKTKSNIPFSRIPKDTKVDPRFSSNNYVSYDYADRAYQDLSVTKGKGFTKEKNKKKRGSYRGGVIDTTPKGIKFDD